MQQVYHQGVPLVSHWQTQQPPIPQQTYREWDRGRRYMLREARILWWSLWAKRMLRYIWQWDRFGACVLAFAVLFTAAAFAAQPHLAAREAERVAMQRILDAVVVINEPPPPIATPPAVPAPTPQRWMYPGDDAPRVTRRAKREHTSKQNLVARR